MMMVVNGGRLEDAGKVGDSVMVTKMVRWWINLTMIITMMMMIMAMVVVKSTTMMMMMMMMKMVIAVMVIVVVAVIVVVVDRGASMVYPLPLNRGD